MRRPPRGEQRLRREGLLVERAGRAAGRIAAVAWLELHGATPLVINDVNTIQYP